MERTSAHRNDPSLLIADDHAVFAETLQPYLEKSYTVVGVVLNSRAMVSLSVNQAFGPPKPRDVQLGNPPVVWERGYL
jgi:ActR/RegA family two-component response regulator